jgi:hypothetical protein
MTRRSYAVRSIFPVGAQCIAPLPSVNCVSPNPVGRRD